MDRYLSSRPTPLPNYEYQMVGLTCYLIISKLVEIVPVCLEDLVETFCINKYRSEQFVWAETDIFSALGCDIETPHILEFTTFYFKALRFYIQCS